MAEVTPRRIHKLTRKVNQMKKGFKATGASALAAGEAIHSLAVAWYTPSKSKSLLLARHRRRRHK